MRRRNRRRSRILRAVLRVFVVALVGGLFYMASYIEHHYTRTGIVQEITCDNTVLVKDTLGYLWEAPGVYEPGTEVRMKMYTMCTSGIADDVVLSTKVIGGEVEQK